MKFCLAGPLLSPTHFPPVQSVAFLKGPSDKHALDNVTHWTTDDIKVYAKEKVGKGLGPNVLRQHRTTS